MCVFVYGGSLVWVIFVYVRQYDHNYNYPVPYYTPIPHQFVIHVLIEIIRKNSLKFGIGMHAFS